MSYTKEQLIRTAYENCGLITPDDLELKAGQLEVGKKRADMLAASWANKDIHFPYPQADNPDESNIAMDSGVYMGCVRAFTSQLAIDIAVTLGYPVSREMKTIAKDAYNEMILNDEIFPASCRDFPNTMPQGFGKKSWQGGRSTYYRSRGQRY